MESKMTFAEKVKAVKQMIAEGKPIHEIEDKLDALEQREDLK
jgi:fatty acid-binding protein DegV